MTKRAILYARVSGDDRANATSSVENQLSACHHYASERGYQVIEEVFEEPNRLTSGADWLPGIMRVLDMAVEGAFDVLIARDHERLSRDKDKYNDLRVHLIKTCGVAIEYINGRGPVADEAEDTAGYMTDEIESMVAHVNHKRLIKKLHNAIKDSVRKNGLIKTGGCGAPYGYDLTKWTSPDGKPRCGLKVNELEAEVVRLIFDWRANEGSGYYVIAQRLDGLGIPKPMKGRAQQAKAKQEVDRQWSISTIDGILSSEVYVGRWHYAKTKTVKNPKTGKKSHVPRPKEEWIQVNVEPIISDSLFTAAQVVGKANKSQAGKQHRRLYTIGGMLTCGRCGLSMTGVTRGRPDGKHSYYACNARLQKRTYGRACDLPYFRVEAVDAAIWAWVKGILLEPARLAEGLKKYQDSQRTALRPFYSMLESSEREHAALLTEKERLVEAYAKGVLSLDDIAKRKGELDRQLSDISRAVARLRVDLSQKVPTAQTIEMLEHLAQQVRDRADLADTDAEKQRQLYRLIQLHVTLDEVDGRQVAQVECMLGQLQLSATSETASCIGCSTVRAVQAVVRASPAQ